ncbi:MAG: SDR family oxidoreductase [Actinomycetota bacterium]|nr:SDR family oxidoreductase [Actinomycetota bacterium]
MRFEGLNAIVTGGLSGIGKAAVDRLTDEGAEVAILDLADDPDQRSVVLDIADVDTVAPTVAGVADQLGQIDVLVNCAGWDRAQLFIDTDPGFWKRVLDINLLGPIAVTHAVLAHMPEGGSIVNVASDAGRVGSSGEVVYSGAKGGVIAFTKALARETARNQIRVNAVAPGPTTTPFLDSFDDTGKLADAMTRQTPLRKLASPQDIASAICYLASRDAGHITGQVLSVSGGLTMV